MSDFKYKRILLKLSGEAFSAKDGQAFDMNLLEQISNEVKKIIESGVEVAVVIGGGNIIRGASQEWMNRENADYMGMLATVINSMTFGEVLNKYGVKAKVFSAVPMEVVCDTYEISAADKYLSDGCVTILGGGTGKPYVTTDTTATLRATELNCDCVLKATKVDGVYDSDPVKNPDAKRFDKITYAETLERGLKVMDDTAIEMAQKNNIPLIVFNLFEKDNIVKVLQGQDIGTLVS